MARCQVPAEAPRVLRGDAALVENEATSWPAKGAIEFDNVNLRYRPGLPLALRDLSVSVPAGARVGVVGRTGAGKSTLLSALFRLVEMEQPEPELEAVVEAAVEARETTVLGGGLAQDMQEHACTPPPGFGSPAPAAAAAGRGQKGGGSIRIDGVDVRGVGLRLLRSKLAMIPQEASLIEGTVRENLDPFGLHTWPGALERCLAVVGLDPSMLDDEVGAGGESLSVGQRQLLSLARVLLRSQQHGGALAAAQAGGQAGGQGGGQSSGGQSGGGCRVYVMDEPTAHIDPATDLQLQRVMRQELAGCTLVVIAHRLETVADFDVVLVLDQGRLVEEGRPWDLLEKPKSQQGAFFRDMVHALGPDAARAIRSKASKANNGTSGAEQEADAGSDPRA